MLFATRKHSKSVPSPMRISEKELGFCQVGGGNLKGLGPLRKRVLAQEEEKVRKVGIWGEVVLSEAVPHLLSRTVHLTSNRIVRDMSPYWK